MEVSLNFSDVLIKPKFSNVSNENDVDLVRSFRFKYSKKTLSNVPVMCSNIDTVANFELFKVLSSYNMFTTFNKNMEVEEFKANKDLLEKYEDNFAISIGISDCEIEKLHLINRILDFKCICVDVENGHLINFVNFCLRVRNNFPDKIIMAGNVVCKNMVYSLVTNGKVDVVKVGIGGGSNCSSRIKAGVGVPQLSAIMECAYEAHLLGAHVISDGDITCPGDLGKSFGAGADFVMICGKFDGHDQNPGNIIEQDGHKFKLFYGEGRILTIEYKGDLNDTVIDFLGGLRLLCTYTNSKNIIELHKNVTFIRVFS